MNTEYIAYVKNYVEEKFGDTLYFYSEPMALLASYGLSNINRHTVFSIKQNKNDYIFSSTLKKRFRYLDKDGKSYKENLSPKLKEFFKEDYLTKLNFPVTIYNTLCGILDPLSQFTQEDHFVSLDLILKNFPEDPVIEYKYVFSMYSNMYGRANCEIIMNKDLELIDVKLYDNLHLFEQHSEKFNLDDKLCFLKVILCSFLDESYHEAVDLRNTNPFDFNEFHLKLYEMMDI